MMYKAQIEFQAYEDSYTDGEISGVENTWVQKFEAETIKELKEDIEQATYNKFKDIEYDDLNEYEQWSEYWTSYLTTEDNEGVVNDKEYEQWKQGKLRLWSVHCHILVSEIIEKKAVLR